MRTNKKDNEILGNTLAKKVNRATAPATVLLPLGGVSNIGGANGDFYRPEIDAVLFSAIKKHLKDSITILEVHANINTTDFAEQAVKSLLELLGK